MSALAPYYVSELDVSGEKGAGVALIKIFANMLKLVIDRLNRVPEKNFAAFLDMLGIKLLPAQPARVPVTFYLSEGAAENVLIPEKSQTSAEEIVFETKKNMVATPSKLVKVYSISIDKDGIFESPSNIVKGEVAFPFSSTLIFSAAEGGRNLVLREVSDLEKGDVLKIEDTEGIEYVELSEVSDTKVSIKDKLVHTHGVGASVEKVTKLELFEGKNLQDHILYLGHDDLFNIKGEATITTKVINSEYASKLGDSDFVQWEYWGEAIRTEGKKEIKEIRWHPLNILLNDRISLQKKQWTDTKGQTWIPGEIKEYEINAIKSRWIRCKLKTPISKETKLPTIDIIGVEIENSVSPDMVFHNDVPINMALTYKLTSHVSAGARSIELNDVTGLEKGDILEIVDHGKLEEVAISSISNKAINIEDQLQYDHSSNILVKKYKEFYPFGRKPRIFDTFYIGCSDAFSKKGASITLTFSIKHEHDDIPVMRIHGVGEKFADKLKTASIHTAEELLKYTPQQLAVILGTKQIKTAINILESAKKAFYDKTMQTEKEDEEEKEELPSQDSQEELTLSWEYWNGEGWIVIKDLDDKTDRFLENGEKTVIFTCPSDIKTVKVNGQENYWIRVKIVDGDYGKEKFKEENGTWIADTSQINPPVINKLTITYAVSSQNLQHCLTYNNLEFKDVTEESKTKDKTFEPFQPLDDEHQTLYLGLDKKIEKGPISIFFSLEEQEFLIEDMPKIEWYCYSQDKKWVRLEVLDDTQNLTRTGAVEFIVPTEFAKTAKFGDELYGIKAVDIEDKFRTQSPIVKGIYPNTTFAIQAESIEDELLGSSDGSANQKFEFTKKPVIKEKEEIWVNETGTLLEEEKKTIIEEKGEDYVSESKDENGKTMEAWVRWQVVEDFFDSTSKSRHYVVDRATGEVKFGDGVHGMVPPIGRDNIKATYQVGGGEKGNVGASEISTIKTSIPFVDRVTNPEAAGGGADIEILENAMERGPWVVKHRNRAVTVEDFEWLARQASRDVVRVKCMQNRNESGSVTVIIAPASEEDKPTPSLERKKVVEEYLLEHCSDVVSLQVKGPEYIEVSVSADVYPTSIDVAPLAEKEALKRLKEFLHPLTGGENGKGWEFGRLVCLSDIYALLEGIAEIDHVENVTVSMMRAEEGERTIVTPEAWIPNALICSGEHRTNIKFKGAI
ncbi:putative baseplate assembly protein [candidate division WOR-3 bacterium]|nr:putative baseplate assembly protein [candidate division WOR-3 bacterium]